MSFNKQDTKGGWITLSYKYFDWIKEGKKTIELRKASFQDRFKIAPGDILKFCRAYTTTHLFCRVVQVLDLSKLQAEIVKDILVSKAMFEGDINTVNSGGDKSFIPEIGYELELLEFVQGEDKPITLYRIDNTVNDLVFFGWTTRTMEERLRRHGIDAARGSKNPLDHDVKKYGADKYQITKLQDCTDKEDAKIKVEQLVSAHGIEKTYNNLNKDYESPDAPIEATAIQSFIEPAKPITWVCYKCDSVNDNNIFHCSSCFDNINKEETLPVVLPKGDLIQEIKTTGKQTELVTEIAVQKTASSVANKLVDAQDISIELMSIKYNEIMNKVKNGQNVSFKEWALIPEYASKIDTILKSRRRGKDTPTVAIQNNTFGGMNSKREVKTPTFVKGRTIEDIEVINEEE